METAPDEFLIPEVISRNWAAEFQRAFDALKTGAVLAPPEKSAPADLEDFKLRLAVLGKGFMNYDLLVSKLEQITKIAASGQFTSYFPPNSVHCVAALPFDNYGYDLTPNELKDGEFLKRLRVAPDGLTRHFTDTPAYYFQLLPEEIQKNCSFTVPAYPANLPPADLVDRVKGMYNQAFLNLRLLIDTENKAQA